MNRHMKEVQTKLMKGLLDLIVLQFLKSRPMHGYQIISSIRKDFGVYFGPSTIYPMLNGLERKGYIKSQWDLNNDRPRKVYTLTTEGQKLLGFTQDSLSDICRKLNNVRINRTIVGGPLEEELYKVTKKLNEHKL